jgi:hypothetical protein
MWSFRLMCSTLYNLCVYIIINTTWSIKDDGENHFFILLNYPFPFLSLTLPSPLFPYHLLSFSTHYCSSSHTLSTVHWVSSSMIRTNLFWQFLSPARISTENLSIELSVYVIATEEFYEIAISLISHAMNFKILFFLDGCYGRSMMCLVKQSIFALRDTDTFFYCMPICKRRIFELQVQYILHSVPLMLYAWLLCHALFRWNN